MILFGAIGSLIFSSLANHIDSEIPRKMLGGLLIFGGIFSLHSNMKYKFKKLF